MVHLLFYHWIQIPIIVRSEFQLGSLAEILQHFTSLIFFYSGCLSSLYLLVNMWFILGRKLYLNWLNAISFASVLNAINYYVVSIIFSTLQHSKKNWFVRLSILKIIFIRKYLSRGKLISKMFLFCLHQFKKNIRPFERRATSDEKNVAKSFNASIYSIVATTVIEYTTWVFVNSSKNDEGISNLIQK